MMTHCLSDYTFILITLISVAVFTGCNNDDDEPTIQIEEPTTYSFIRDGQSTVSFSGQTTRIQMAQELISSLKDFDSANPHVLIRNV